MLYIFHVDNGRMMTFDMSLALESVAFLKQAVEQTCNIPVEKQVLLVSGGESLNESSKVCTYSAGTDTNPIFLFSKSNIESRTPPSVSIDFGSDDVPDYFKKQVKDAQELPATYETVVSRAQLATQFYESANCIAKVCDTLVHEQHLQQQGWAAVIANLEDLTLEFKKRSEVFENSFNDYLKDHDNYTKFLQYFTDDLEILARIPVLPSLLDGYQKLNAAIGEASEETLKDGETENVSPENRNGLTLLEWISSTDSRSTMDQLFEHCSRGLQQFNEEIFNNLRTEVNNALETSNRIEMKEVKGLGDRLYGLEQLMVEAKRYVSEQADLAKSFQQNQSRAGNLGDTSILPDLCDSHRKQLYVMLGNHDQLCDIRRRCMKAKEELSINLYHRLRWVMYVENTILEVNHKLVVYHDNLKRLRQHLEVLQQIHLAPATYLSAIAEVVRRRTFSQNFLLWASELACHILTIHNEEIQKRKEFQSIFEGHFLNALFPGMEDLPPNFATEAPSIFDSCLPPVTNEDIQNLKETLPEFTENLTLLDVSAITNFFLTKSLVKTELDKVDMEIEDKLVQVVKEVGLTCNLDQNLMKPNESEACLTTHGLAHLKDIDKGFESETDTEEFEKVCQSPLELQFDKELLSTRPGLQDASTITEVGEKYPLLPPKKPPRSFQKLAAYECCHNQPVPRTLSISGSNTESFTNIKNISLESIDELTSFKNTESCHNLHHLQQQQPLHCMATSSYLGTSKSMSPRTPQSPRDECPLPTFSPVSPSQGHQPSDFVNEEYYIDESLPSSLSIETGNTTYGDYTKQLSNANDVVALLQENLETSQTEHDRLKKLVANMALLSRQAIVQLKRELKQLKSHYELEKKSIEMQYSSLGSSWENLTVEMDREQGIVQKLTTDFETKVEEYKKMLEINNESIKFLQLKNLDLENSLKRLSEEKLNMESQNTKFRENEEKELNLLKFKVQELETDKEKSIKEMSEKLQKEHKVQMETLRSRFRLVAGQSSSESNLEKERKSAEATENLIKELKQTADLEKQKVIESQTKLEAVGKAMILEISNLKKQFEDEKKALIESIGKDLTVEKDKEIDILLEQLASLKMQCIKYKNTIEQLTSDSDRPSNVEVAGKADNLEKQKCQLETEQCMERSKRLEFYDMGASVAVCEGVKVDVATSPVKYREKLTKVQTSLINSGKLSIETCSPGDLVLIIWNSIHDNYIVLQQSPSLFFLHADCLEALGLKKNTSDEKKIPYCIGEVTEKEYCHAKRSENRYKVPRGTKFYRVKVKPSPLRDATKCLQMSQSQIVCGPPTTEQPLSDIASQSLPTSPTKGPKVESAMKVTDDPSNKEKGNR